MWIKSVEIDDNVNNFNGGDDDDDDVSNDND